MLQKCPSDQHTEGNNDESIEFGKSVQSLTNVMDSDFNTGVSQSVGTEEGTAQIENEGMYEKNVEHCANDDYYVVQKDLLHANGIEKNMPEGRSIVDINFMYNEIQRSYNDHIRGVECLFRDWTLVNSRRRGLRTQLFFKCKMCNYETNIWSEPEKSDTLDINTAAAAGTITIGIGYYQLQELHAAMNIPCMSEVTYIKYRDNVVDDFEKTAIENMKLAGEAEKQLALERNETINGIPYITVVADGSWMKRSYGTTYDSLSGVGAIIGFRTKKVLFIGIRNKFCTICNMAEQNSVEPRVHKCYKNFGSNRSSTSMESDAIVEGFKSSLEMHGLIYRSFVGDGDSNVYQSIIDNAPYREHMVTVKKIECSNHLLRNLCRKLKIVAETTQPKTQRKRGIVQLRKIVKDNIVPIREEVKNAAAVRREENHSDVRHKARELQKDILNIPSHVFGEHKQCKERGLMCTENRDETEKNYVPFLKLHGLYQKVENAIMFLSGYSDSLLLNLSTNAVESFNSVICKLIGGKRIDYSKRGSYNARVSGAVVQFNTQQVLTELHGAVCNSVPTVIENLEKQRQIKVARNRESRSTKETKKFKSGTDRYYGPQSQKPDLPDEVLEELRKSQLNKLFDNGKNWKQIECDTRGQSECELWQLLRREMLTASNFGTVCRLRLTTSCAATVKNIIYPPSIDTAAMKYGREKEEIARKELALQINKEIKICGLFIDCKNPWLGASPDGLIDEDGVVEIKCPPSAELLTAEEAIKTLPQLRSIFDKKNPDRMNQNHRFFYQVQGQLNITQREYCIFAIWTPKSIKTVRVSRDIDFWKNEMQPLLTRFYKECMLPEILDSRYNRHMPIRNPKYILEAQENACRKKINRKVNEVNIDNDNDANSKRIKRDVLSTETVNTDSIAILDADQDNDCIIVSCSSKKRDLTDEDMGRCKKFLDEFIAPLSEVTENVLPIDSKLNDGSLDRFLRVVRDTSCFETQSVLYLEYPDMIVGSINKSVQIIGGNCTDHWRCIFFDGTKLRVYDSLPGCTYDKLAPKEKQYIRLRYPKVSESEIIIEKVQTQPDGTCCGIYAAAFATTVALGGNPCDEKYSSNAECMRQHFIKIIELNRLMPFPNK